MIVGQLERLPVAEILVSVEMAAAVVVLVAVALKSAAEAKNDLGQAILN